MGEKEGRRPVHRYTKTIQPVKMAVLLTTTGVAFGIEQKLKFVTGVLNFVLDLVPDGGLSPALINGAISGALCGILLFILSLVDGRPILWWAVLITSFAIPFVGNAMS